MVLFPYTWLQGPSNYHSPVANTNRQGFRTDEMETIVNDERETVVLLGGSGLWGAGASSDDTTIGGVLQNKINYYNIPLKVVNLAQPGFQSIQELITFERIVLRLNPRYIVIMNGGNDINHAMWQQSVGTPAFWAEMEYIMNSNKKSSNSHLSNYIGSLRTVQILERYLKKDSKTENNSTLPPRTALFDNRTLDDIQKEIITQYRINMRCILQLAKANGIQAILILQPTVSTIKPSNHLEEKLSTSKFFADTYDLLSKVQVELKNEFKIIQIDGASIFNADLSKKTKIFDEFHYTDYGNQLIGEWIFNKIDENEKHTPALRSTKH